MSGNILAENKIPIRFKIWDQRRLSHFVAFQTYGILWTVSHLYFKYLWHYKSNKRWIILAQSMLQQHTMKAISAERRKKTPN